MGIDLRETFVAWHSAPADIHDEIETSGLKVEREAIWYAIHPLIPTAFQRPEHDFQLYQISIPIDRLEDESQAVHRMQEGRLFADLPASHTEIVTDADTCRERLRQAHDEPTKGPDGGRRCIFMPSLIVRGYEEWLDAESLAASVQDVLEDSDAPLISALLGLHYWHFSSSGIARSMAEEAQKTWERLLGRAPELSASQLALLVGIGRPLLDRTFVDQLAGAPLTLTQQIQVLPSMKPVQRKHFIRQATPKHSLSDQWLRNISSVLQGKLPEDVPEWSSEAADGMAWMLAYGGLNNEQGIELLRCLADAPFEYSRHCWPFLAFHIRDIPRKARKHLEMLLKSYRSLLQEELEALLEYPGLTHKTITRILSS